MACLECLLAVITRRYDLHGAWTIRVGKGYLRGSICGMIHENRV